MSMNIYIQAKRSVTVDATGENSVQTITFDVRQTPTEVTYKIVNSVNQKQEYIDWLMSFLKDEEFPVYAEDDMFCEREPIGMEIVNHCKEDVSEFVSWCDFVETKGYVIEYLVD